MATANKQINGSQIYKVNQYQKIEQQINALYWILKDNNNAHPKFVKEVKDAIAALEKILPYF